MSKRIIKKKAKQLEALHDCLYSHAPTTEKHIPLVREADNLLKIYYKDFVRLKSRHLSYNSIYVIHGPCGPWLPKYFSPLPFKNGNNVYELDVMACSGRFTDAEIEFHADMMGW